MYIIINNLLLEGIVCAGSCNNSFSMDVGCEWTNDYQVNTASDWSIYILQYSPLIGQSTSILASYRSLFQFDTALLLSVFLGMFGADR